MSLLGQFNTGRNYLSQPIFAPTCNLDSVPPQIKVGGGTCFVIGCHPCWQDDVRGAAKKYPNAKICLVNYAVELLPGDYIATVHGDQLPEYSKLYKGFWPDAKEPVLIQRDMEPSSDIGHRIDARTHAASGSFAAAAMAMIGFDLAIMCGSPIDGTGGYAQSTYFENDWHDGKCNRIRAWHEGMRKFKEQFPEIAAKMRSMSGATKEIFGGLDDN